MISSTPRKVSRLQEKRAAKDYKGKTTPGSGNQWHSKGDVRSADYLIECKTTSKASYSLRADTMSKIMDEALLENRTPIMEVEFGEHGITCVIMDKNDFLEIMLERSHGSQA
jgi:hypothetical protein